MPLYKITLGYNGEYDPYLAPHPSLIKKEGNGKIQFEFFSKQNLYFIENIEILYENCVIESFTKNSRIMSDVYADCYYVKIWNQEKQCVEDISIGNSEFYDKKTEYFTVPDLSEENNKQYQQFLKDREQEQKDLEEKRQKEAAERIRLTPTKGKTIRVIKGRKIPLNTEGIVFWRGTDKYGNINCGILDNTGNKFYTNEKNIKVIDASIKELPKPEQKLLRIKCSISEEREKAFKVQFTNRSEWLPKSQVKFENGELIIPEWLAKKNNIKA